MQKIRKILNRNKQLKIGKEKALKSKNIKDINDYIALLLHYVDNKEITLKDSHYKRCIEIIALSNEKMVFHFLNSLEFSSKQDSPERKEMILSLISMIKEYNPSIINLDMIEFLFFENKYLNFYKYEIRNNIGKDEIAEIILKTEDLEKMYQYSLLFDDCDVSLFEDFIIECNNLEYIYKFARDIKGANISKLEDVIINSKDVHYIHKFARDVKGANILKLEDAIIETKDTEKIFLFALYIKGANVSKLEDAIIEAKDAYYAYYIYWFAFHVKGANVSKLENAIIETKDANYIYEFALHVKGANVSKLEDAIIETKDANYIYEFALYVKGANVSKLEDAIIETKDAKYIYEFAHDVKGANVSKLEAAIIETKDANYIYEFAHDVKGVNVSKLEDAIIETKDANYIYEFALNIKGANVLKLEDAIIDSKDINYIYKFAHDIKWANISKLETAIISSKNAEGIYCFARFIKEVNVSKLEDAITETKNAKYIYKFAHDIKGVNIPKLEDAIIETKAVQEISYFACFIKGANVEKLCSALFEFKGYRYVLDVLLSVKVDKNILEQYIKKLIFVGEIVYVENLLDYYIEKHKNSNNEKLSTAKKSDMRINQLIEMNLLDKADIDDYLVKVSTNKQRSFKDNILGLDNHTKKSLLESKDKNSSVNETDLIYDDWIYDGLNSFPNTKDSRLKLINLSLIYYNVLPSVVKDFKEVRENVELYLELLKKCDEKKYYYYKNAFEGKISFEQADTYYKYYLDQLLDSHVYLWGDMSHILKLKYSKK